MPKSKEQLYRITISVEPACFYVEESFKSRREAEAYARHLAADPVEGLDPEEYVTTWKVEKLGPAEGPKGVPRSSRVR